MAKEIIRGLEEGISIAALPTIKIGNANSPEFKDKKIGIEFLNKFYDTEDFVNFGDKMDLILYFNYKVKMKFGAEDSSGIECVSLDLKTGNKYGECEKCIHGIFDKDNAERCRESITLVVAPVDDPERLMKLIIKKTGFKEWKEYRKKVKSFVGKNKVQSTTDMITTITIDMISSLEYTWTGFKMNITGLTDPKKQAARNKKYDEIKEIVTDEIEEFTASVTQLKTAEEVVAAMMPDVKEIDVAEEVPDVETQAVEF